MTSLQEWAEDHNEALLCKEIVHHKVHDYGIWINEHVDYRFIIDIMVYIDGTREVYIIEEVLQVFDDEGNITDSFDVSMPKKYREQAIKAGEDYEF